MGKGFLPAFKSWISSVSKGKAEPGQCCVLVFYGMWVFFEQCGNLQHHLTQLGLGQVHLVVFLLQKVFQVLNLSSQQGYISSLLFQNFKCLLGSMKTCFLREIENQIVFM